jgi:hypothetical protein
MVWGSADFTITNTHAGVLRCAAAATLCGRLGSSRKLVVWRDFSFQVSKSV